MSVRVLFVAPLLCAVAACGSQIQTEFAVPNGTSETAKINEELNSPAHRQDYDPDLGGYASVVGMRDFEGARGLAGLMPGSDPGAVINAGTARYDAAYKVTVMENIHADSGYLFGSVVSYANDVRLTANFDNGTLKGDNGFLVVNGDIAGRDVSGDVVYEGVPGELDGLIGARGVVGAFHGSNDDTLFAGGLIGK